MCVRACWCRWYSQAGTPELTVTTSYNPSDQTYTIKTKQVSSGIGHRHGGQAHAVLCLSYSVSGGDVAGACRALEPKRNCFTFLSRSQHPVLALRIPGYLVCSPHPCLCPPPPTPAMQRTPPTRGQPTKLPVLIPLRLGLLGPDGTEMQLKLKGR